MLCEGGMRGRLNPNIKFRLGQKVMIVKDAMKYEYPTPLRGFIVHEIMQDSCRMMGKTIYTYKIEMNGSVSGYLEEWQLAAETPPPPISLNDRIIHGDD